jgi:hypothetical protein
MSTKRDRDDLHHRACRAAYEQGLIGDDDRKVFIYREIIDGIEVPCLKCVVAREPDPSNTTVRADTWSIERSTRNDLDAIVSLGVKVTLLLYCEIVNDVVEVRYHTAGINPQELYPMVTIKGMSDDSSGLRQCDGPSEQAVSG